MGDTKDAPKQRPLSETSMSQAVVGRCRPTAQDAHQGNAEVMVICNGSAYGEQVLRVSHLKGIGREEFGCFQNPQHLCLDKANCQ
jgi:hypothetical protein